MGPTGEAGLGENEPVCSGEELGGAEAEAGAAGTVGRRGCCRWRSQSHPHVDSSGERLQHVPPLPLGGECADLVGKRVHLQCSKIWGQHTGGG